MNHLSPGEFVDAADGVLPALRQAHLDQCARCAEEARAIRFAIDAARQPQVPEPSPLYWVHLAARVRDQVAAESIMPAWRASWRAFRLRRLMPVASAVAVVAAVFVSGLMTRPGRVAEPPAVAGVVRSVLADPGVELDDADAWDMLTSAAAETPIEDAHAAGMAVGAGAVDRAVQRMNPDELHELKRLLQSELRRSGD